MYNMEISIGSYKFRLEIVILIIFVFWLMFGHMLCSCCLVSLTEGLETMGVVMPAMPKIMKKNIKKAENITKEGFTGYNNTTEFADSNDSGIIMPTKSWSMPTLTYSPGTTPDAGVKAIWDRKQQPIPLPEGELDMFATTEFKPECCPNAYSSSTGCACMTMDQYTYLRERGSNNIPYSEY